MKKRLILTGFVCLFALLLSACAPAPEPEPEPQPAPEPVFDQAAEEAAIRKVVEKIIETANAHDVEAYTALHAEYAESWDGTAKGRVAWGKFVGDLWESQKDIQYKQLEEIGIVFVTPDVAIFKAVDEVTGSLDSDGTPLPPQNELRARVFVKKDGEWLYAAYFSRPIEE
jgi:uncharacterized protein (TIGR02246 family)